MTHVRWVKGFTLIELLIVIFIISIVTSVTLLSFSHNKNKQLESFANELIQMMTLAEEKAMLQSTILGLSLSKTSFQFSSFQQLTDNKKNEWTPLQDTALGLHKIPSNIQVAVHLESAKKSSDEIVEDDPQIIISTSGDITPFTIYIGLKGEKPRYAITGDADGNVTNKLLS